DVITVERVGCALLVAAPGRDRDAADLAAALAPERRRTAVVVGASAAEAMARLDPWVVADLDEQVAGSLRLLAPHAGAVGPAGEVPPARLLAERLGVEVVAPDNALVRLSGGSVFVSGPGAGWVAYRPGATAAAAGPPPRPVVAGAAARWPGGADPPRPVAAHPRWGRPRRRPAAHPEPRPRAAGGRRGRSRRTRARAGRRGGRAARAARRGP
ncbi:hypothetical protein K7G98_11955, partial [Saccharothrix sp. MB29]|nr:hypothetical protein [Saccharothrix sp. MB29]